MRTERGTVPAPVPPITPRHLALGRAARARRAELALTQEQVGIRAGIDMSYVAQIERGERNVSYSTLSRLAEALESPVWQIVRLAEEQAA